MPIIKICQDCPFANRNFMEPCECSHSQVPKNQRRDICMDDTPPKWCPIRKSDNYYRRVIRDTNDRIIKNEEYIIEKNW